MVECRLCQFAEDFHVQIMSLETLASRILNLSSLTFQEKAYVIQTLSHEEELALFAGAETDDQLACVAKVALGMFRLHL
jgi:hypothetical protein